MTRITRRSFSRTGLGIVCTALLWYATAAASAADEALRQAFITELLSRSSTVSPNAGLTPVPVEADFGSAAAEPDGLRAAENECFTVGGYNQGFTGSGWLRGNIFDVNEPETLVQFSMELTITSGQHTDLYFMLYDMSLGGEFCEVFLQHKVVTGAGKAFYACDPVSVPLSTSKFYLAAVAWQQTATVGVRSQTLPTPYGLGSMFFSTGKSGVSLPGDVQDCPSGLPSIDSELYSMRLCFEIPPSACCLPGGTCALLWRSQCQAASGQYTAGRVTCEDVSSNGGCPLPPGACCFPGAPVPCYDFNLFACVDDLGGTFAGIGSSCALESCNPRGACCVYGGTCVEWLTHDECIGSELDPWALNVWHEATECAAVTDCPDLGACCSFTGDSCLQLTQAECSQLWVADAPCPPAGPSPCYTWHQGACCLYNGNCQDNRSPYECQQAGGTYRGDNTVCGTPPCDVLGACCVGTNCFEVKQSTCVNVLRGIWFPVQQCEPNPCRGELGACCNRGNCSIDNQVDCDGAGGTWDGPSTDCDPSPCTPEGACCIGALGCDIMTASACSTAGGAYLGDQSTCFECSFTGACCPPDGFCQELGPGACGAVAGTFTSGATCAQVQCTQTTGACCLAGGSCQEVTSAACGGLNGTFKGVATSCATPGICDPCAAFPGTAKGDYDGDGVANWRDFPLFLGCMTNPGTPATQQCQCAFDFDDDTDVDIDDFGHFQVQYCVYCGCVPLHYDADADVDEADYAAFADCMAGPNADPAPTDPNGHPELCLCVFDADHDWDVDLLDFGSLEDAFTGPLP